MNLICFPGLTRPDTKPQAGKVCSQSWPVTQYSRHRLRCFFFFFKPIMTGLADMEEHHFVATRQICCTGCFTRDVLMQSDKVQRKARDLFSFKGRVTYMLRLATDQLTGRNVYSASHMTPLASLPNLHSTSSTSYSHSCM